LLQQSCQAGWLIIWMIPATCYYFEAFFPTCPDLGSLVCQLVMCHLGAHLQECRTLISLGLSGAPVPKKYQNIVNKSLGINILCLGIGQNNSMQLLETSCHTFLISL
jgi:hypothetical protein